MDLTINVRKLSTILCAQEGPKNYSQYKNYPSINSSDFKCMGHICKSIDSGGHFWSWENIETIKYFRPKKKKRIEKKEIVIIFGDIYNLISPTIRWRLNFLAEYLAARDFLCIHSDHIIKCLFIFFNFFFNL